MNDSLEITPSLSVPLSEFQVQYVRSPGPGGQNVNKVNTKAVVHWPVYRSQLPEPVKHRLMLAEKNRINNDGELVVNSSEHRTQSKNLEACLNRVRQMILAALHPPKKRKPTKVPFSAKRKRLASKREKSEKKQRRSDQSWRDH